YRGRYQSRSQFGHRSASQIGWNTGLSRDHSSGLRSDRGDQHHQLGQRLTGSRSARPYVQCAERQRGHRAGSVEAGGRGQCHPGGRRSAEYAFRRHLRRSDLCHILPAVQGPPAGGLRGRQRRHAPRIQRGLLHNDDRQIDGTGPTVQARFTTTPKQLGTSTDCAALPCDGSVTTYSFRSDAPPLGAELWAFLPQDLLPQLRWLTATNYDHVYYVDLTPKVTDVRIFTPDADHPGGWGTILIGGFRLGGSCTNCTSSQGTPPVVKGRPRVVQADFNNNGTTTDTGNGASGKNSDFRGFLSSYFVLDITSSEKEPRLLWVFRDQNLGLTTADPGIVRVNPVSNASTSSTNV